MKIHSLICLLLIVCLDTFSANRFVVFEKESNAFSLVSDNKIINILIDKELATLNFEWRKDSIPLMPEEKYRMLKLQNHLH